MGVCLALEGTLGEDVLRLQARSDSVGVGGASDERLTGEDVAILFSLRMRGDRGGGGRLEAGDACLHLHCTF